MSAAEVITALRVICAVLYALGALLALVLLPDLQDGRGKYPFAGMAAVIGAVFWWLLAVTIVVYKLAHRSVDDDKGTFDE